jgi:hypothetical protein
VKLASNPETDVSRLGASMNHNIKCWELILPHAVSHPTINIDLKAILAWLPARHPGAMYSGCGLGAARAHASASASDSWFQRELRSRRNNVMQHSFTRADGSNPFAGVIFSALRARIARGRGRVVLRIGRTEQFQENRLQGVRPDLIRLFGRMKFIGGHHAVEEPALSVR